LYGIGTGPLPTLDSVPVRRSQHPDPRRAQETYMFPFQRTLA
jgi:hypothetical protein